MSGGPPFRALVGGINGLATTHDNEVASCGKGLEISMLSSEAREIQGGGKTAMQEDEGEPTAAALQSTTGTEVGDERTSLAGFIGNVTTQASQPSPSGLSTAEEDIQGRSGKPHPDEAGVREEEEQGVDSSGDGHDAETSRIGQHGSNELMVGVREVRTQMLLENMLELQDLSLDYLVEFLTQDGVLEKFLSFIVQIDEEEVEEEEPCEGKEGDLASPSNARSSLTLAKERRRRLQRGDVLYEEDEVALSRSYHAMLLLASAEPSVQLLKFLSKKITVITDAMFEVLSPRSRGCIHHACRVMDYLLRSLTEPFLRHVGCNRGSVKRFLGPMVRNLAEPPVAELLMKILTAPSPANQMGQYQISPVAKWRLFESLADWRFLIVLAGEVSISGGHPQQVSAAADFFIDLLDSLATDENGELLLQPIAHCPELLGGLFDRALDLNAPSLQRGDCVRVLLALAGRSCEPEIPASSMALTHFQIPSGLASLPMVPNQFRSVHTLFRSKLATHLRDLCECLLREGGGGAASPGLGGPVAHPGHVVEAPFSYLRLSLVNLLVEIVDPGADNGLKAKERQQSHRRARQQKEEARDVLERVPPALWRLLCQWFFQYPFSNLYHGLFYRLVRCVLRSDDEEVQRILFSKCRLVSSLVDAYCKAGAAMGNRGHVLNICNALRLQAGTQSPVTGWLRNYLKSHESWRRFEEPLRDATETAFLHPGLGLRVPSAFEKREMAEMSTRETTGHSDLGHGLELMCGLRLNDVDLTHDAIRETSRTVVKTEEVAMHASIDYGSPLAYFLGLGEEQEYQADETQANLTSCKKKKKKKGKKRKGKGGVSRHAVEDFEDAIGPEQGYEEDSGVDSTLDV